MGNVLMIDGAEPRKILETVIEKKIPAIMTYLSKGKWHAEHILLTELGASRFDIKVSPRAKQRPINIQFDQPVGISIKYKYGKYILETTVVDLKPCQDSSGGKIVLAIPDRIELVHRRNYFRVDVPEALKVKVTLWHRCHSSDENQSVPPRRSWQGKLVDLSAAGVQVGLDVAGKPDFKKGQFIMLRFTPLPYEKPLILNAQVRTILPTADERRVCLGLQIVGLEVSSEGRSVLKRLCSIVEQYYQMNRSSVKQRDFQTTISQPNPV